MSGPVVTRAAAAILLVVLPMSLAWAAGWGGIVPGQTARKEIEARYGRPTRERQVTEGTLVGAEWTYSGDRAPRGLERMVVGLGLVGPSGYTPDVVRSLTLYPKPHVFPLLMVTNGWGKPDAIGTDEQSGRQALRWNQKAMLVLLDRGGQYAEVMVFGPEEAPR
jgi:hypothetical protein